MNFLSNTTAIRSAVHSLFRGKQIDMAVAFIRADWEEILSDYEGQLRVICWLSSTNTDPYAVESLIRRPRTTVKQRHAMHCKVYFAPSIGGVVGSANRSKAALDDNDTAGQDEAAISFLKNPHCAIFSHGFKICGLTRTRPEQLREPIYPPLKPHLIRLRQRVKKAELGSSLANRDELSSHR
jgi:hypothetical protein